MKYFYSGAIHIHTKNSDGTGDIQQISKAAKKAGLSYVIITDHNYYDTEEGIFNGVNVIKGEEISPDCGSHYLAFGIEQFISPDNNEFKNIEEVKKLGGFGFAAHPDESKERKNKNRPLRWKHKPDNIDGIEIWNWFSDWADSYNDRDIFHIAFSYLFREKLINGAPKDTLKWWDDLNNKYNNIIPAIGGVDAHALKIKKYIIPVTIFRYEYMFKTITNTLILDKPLNNNFEENKQLILNAIKNGNNIITNRKINTNSSIIIKVINETTETYSGETAVLDDNTYFKIELPTDATICVIKDGEEIFRANKKSVNIKIDEKGKYRAEVFYKGKPYIYSNPIRIN